LWPVLDGDQGALADRAASALGSVEPQGGEWGPLFDATFTRADVSRLTTPSIVTDASICALTIAFGNTDPPIRPEPVRDTRSAFCCRDRQTQLTRRFIDRNRLPLRTGARSGPRRDQRVGNRPADGAYQTFGLLLVEMQRALESAIGWLSRPTSGRQCWCS
jgi:hypothetical protein